jgi:hypothetical protein
VLQITIPARRQLFICRTGPRPSGDIEYFCDLAATLGIDSLKYDSPPPSQELMEVDEIAAPASPATSPASPSPPPSRCSSPAPQPAGPSSKRLRSSSKRLRRR